MNERQAKLLEIIIKEYVETSEPVGSKVISSNYNLDLSPASIRLEMVRLEKDGFLYQPHTSAGRVPTDKGYRWYIGSLNENKQDLKSREKEAVKKKLLSFADIDQTIKMAANLLSDLTFCTALVTLSKQEVYYNGISKILRQPEFENHLLALSFADLLDHLSEFLIDLPEVEEEIIYIGEENPYLKKASCAMIITPYVYKDKQGVLGIVGPTRMSYEKNLSLLDFVTNSLREI